MMAQSRAESTTIMFNEICINEEMLPKYTYIYIYMGWGGEVNLCLFKQSNDYVKIVYVAFDPRVIIVN